MRHHRTINTPTFDRTPRNNCGVFSFCAVYVGITHGIKSEGSHISCPHCIESNLRLRYLRLRHSADICSRVLPLVSGTIFHTNRADSNDMAA